MLLWVLILTVFGCMTALLKRSLPMAFKARVLSIQGMIEVMFLLFIIATSNPFQRLDPTPLNGRDLNPILQDPGLAIHPPILYFGYVGFCQAFSFAIAALIEGRVDATWARRVRPWILFAWCTLTLGIALGSWWAYYTLGWGGWWFWDPVENASLMPWLAGTALLHSAVVVEKRDAMKGWTILLAILTFSLSLIGTFLVRSGVLISVHAFANDSTRGTLLLVLLVLLIGGALVLFTIRAPALQSGGLFAPISREGSLVINNLLLCTATATVFLGTLYPIFLQTINGSMVSVGPPFFEKTFIPLMVPLVVTMAVGPLLTWKRADLLATLNRLSIVAVISIITIIIILVVLWPLPVLGAVLGISLAVWLIVGSLFALAERIRLFRVSLFESFNRLVKLPRNTWGLTTAHVGLGIVIAGMTVVTAWRVEEVQLIHPGDRIEIAGYDLKFEGVDRIKGQNFIADRGHFTVTHAGQLVTTMKPEKRWFATAGARVTKSAIYTTGLADLYLVLGETRDDGSWTVHSWYNPLVPWIWFGCITMTVGGILSLSDLRQVLSNPGYSLVL
jgi:cytochrome c-type biogenesis protein CcmF